MLHYRAWIRTKPARGTSGAEFSDHLNRREETYNSSSVLTSSDGIQIGGIKFLAGLRKIGRERITGYLLASKK